MKNVFHHVHRHIKQHHKKYVFGFFGGFAVAKLFLLILGLSVVPYGHIQTFADLQSGCVMTGQYYTGEYLTGQSLSAGYTTGCTSIPGYWSGGSLDASGVLVGAEYIEEIQTGCIVVGQEMTGGYLTGGYRTGGTEVCTIESTGTIQTGIMQTGITQQEPIVMLGNGICESGDIVWGTPVSGNFVSNIFPITWAYSGSDCFMSGLLLQLRDHNNQWVSLSSFASGSTGFTFNSAPLYSFQQTGFYHILRTGMSGQQTYIYTGQYSGSYSRLFSGYKLRLLTPAQTVITETSSFTIDNQSPTLTGMTLLSSGASTGYLAKTGIVTLVFAASEELSGVQATLSSGMVATSTSLSGLHYIYTRNLSSLYTEGPLVARIAFADKAGNTGLLVYTSSLIFDITKPIITGFVFGESSSGLLLNFGSSEAVKYTFSYQKTGSTLSTGASADYLTAQQLNFSGIQRDQLYTFALSVYDRAGNSRSATGDFFYSNLGVITSHVSLVPVVDEAVLSGSLASLAVVLKAEVSKFNACKNALTYSPVELTINKAIFTLQMPTFKKSQVKTLVNAFTLFILDKVKNNHSIDATEITALTKKFNSFLVVLKLLRDDDNSCKQNLSNYHVNQFKRTLQEYNISLN